MERHTTSLTVSAQLFLVNRKFHIEIVRDQSKRGPYTRLELHSCLLHDAECNLLATAEFLVTAIMHRTYNNYNISDSSQQSCSCPHLGRHA